MKKCSPNWIWYKTSEMIYFWHDVLLAWHAFAMKCFWNDVLLTWRSFAMTCFWHDLLLAWCAFGMMYLWYDLLVVKLACGLGMTHFWPQASHFTNIACQSQVTYIMHTKNRSDQKHVIPKSFHTKSMSCH